MNDSVEMLECVAFILVRDSQFLAEKRRADKAVDPGITAIPAGISTTERRRRPD